MFDASALAGMTRPVLATSTDGVGTKVAIAQALDRHDTIGFDLVGMVVDDIVVCGAEPLFMTDYIATGQVVPERIAAIVSGIAAACEQAGSPSWVARRPSTPGCSTPTSTTWPVPPPGSWSMPTCWVPTASRPATSSLALGSSGLHSNGYSLVRKVIGAAGWELDRHVDEFGQTLGEELLTPTRVYSADLLDLIRTDGVDLHALSHVTGGGLAANLARVLPAGRLRPARPLHLDPAARCSPTIGALGQVPRADLERTLNMGVGFVAMLPADQVDAATRELEARGIPAWVIGEVTAAEAAPVESGVEVVRGAKGVEGGAVQVVGEHPLG